MNVRSCVSLILGAAAFTVVGAQAWVPVWSDEFEIAGAPVAASWEYDVGGGGWGNNELQYYTNDRRENARVENGHLVIEARAESYEGRDYTSARMLSKESWLYGRIDVRAQLPTGLGTWPAIWMLPTDWEYGEWPASGELDIMEHVGYDPGRVHSNIHTASYNWPLGTNKGNNVVDASVTSEFHTYSLEWNADTVTYFLDDVQIFKFGNERTDYKVWPFDKRFHLILNIAFGGNWGGAQGVDPAALPTQMLIDYVRVFEWDENASGVVAAPSLCAGPAMSICQSAGTLVVNGVDAQSRVSLSDLSGRMIRASAAYGATASLGLAGVAPGVYQVTGVRGGSRVSRSFILQ